MLQLLRQGLSTTGAALLGSGPDGCQRDAGEGEEQPRSFWCDWAGGAAVLAVALMLVCCCVCFRRRSRYVPPPPGLSALYSPTSELAPPVAPLQRRIVNREPPAVDKQVSRDRRLPSAASYYHAVQFDDDAEAEGSDLTFV
jgi:hypothetical protein